MSEQQDELGRSVTQAVRFLIGFHQDVSQLFAALDTLMETAGRYPTDPDRVSYDLSNKNNPARWSLDILFRFYVTAEAFDTIVGVVISLNPPGGFDQAQLLAFTAAYPNPAAWPLEWYTDAVLKGFFAAPGPRSFSPAESKHFLPGANALFGFVVPLCHLSGADDLRERVVSPLLGSP